MTPPVVTASRVEQEHVVSVIILAFVTDPVTRWALADPAEYLDHMPAVVDALGGGALDHATAYCIEGYLGAAPWLPPGAHPDLESLGALVERTVPVPRFRFAPHASSTATSQITQTPTTNADQKDAGKEGG
jgi:hypothetical protein